MAGLCPSFASLALRVPMTAAMSSHPQPDAHIHKNKMAFVQLRQNAIGMSRSKLSVACGA